MTESDWDASTRAFRCSALALPGAEVAAIHAAGRELSSSEVRVEASAKEIRYLPSADPPHELAVTIHVAPALTTWRKAGLSSGALAIATALIAATAQYLAAVVPAQISASSAHADGDRCKVDLAALQRQLAKHDDAPVEHNTTHGDAAPIVHGSGTVSIQHGSR